MELGRVYHRTTDNLCYALNHDVLAVSIQTGYDVDHIWIYYGDPFDHGIFGGNEKWLGTKVEIIQKKRLASHILWTVKLTPMFKRCRYYFELESKGESIYYFEEGFLSEKELNLSGKIPQYFTYPWMNPIDLNVTPDWVKDTVWYQIFPDRFCNGNPMRNLEGTKTWSYGKVSYNDYFGGDLEGIIEKLDYLHQLGISGIYLTPIFKSNSNHKYDTIDYQMIDSCFGNPQLLKELVIKAHELGIKIMLDGVFNHCGTKFAPWRDVLKYGEESPYYSWFMVNQWPFDKNSHNTRDGKFYSFAFTAGMPKLNTNNKEVINYFSDICASWVTEYDIDGIRFDVGNEVSHKFLKTIRERLKNIKPSIYLLGEIWHDAIPWLRGDEYDSIMNYPLTSSIHNFWIDKSLNSEDFEFAINRCYSMYMEQSNKVLFNLLDSHDTDRLIHRTKDLAIFYQQLVIVFTMPGTPCIYYGTELALEGGHDPDCRRCMPWEAIAAGNYNNKIAQIKQLISCRTTIEAFKSQTIEFTASYEGKRIIEYIKYDENGNGVKILLNCCQEDIKPLNAHKIIFSYEYEDGNLYPNGSLILEL